MGMPVRLLPPTLVVFLFVLSLSCQPDSRTSGNEPADPTIVPVVETSIVLYAPIQRPAKQATAELCRPSTVLSRDGVWRCFTSSGPREPCFGALGAMEVICPGNPPMSSPHASTVLLESPLVGVESENQAGEAWWVETSDGRLCGFNPYGTAPVVNGERIDFWCEDGTGLLGLPEPGKVWTARQVPIPSGTQSRTAPETMVELRTVWR
jgi:hypothetical protein